MGGTPVRSLSFRESLAALGPVYAVVREEIGEIGPNDRE